MRTKTRGPVNHMNRAEAAAFFMLSADTIEAIVARYHVTTRIVKSTHFYPSEEIQEAVSRWADERPERIRRSYPRRKPKTRAPIG